MDTRAGVHVTIAGTSIDAPLFGLRGAMQHAAAAKTNLNEDRTTPGENSANGGYLQVRAQHVHCCLFEESWVYSVRIT